MPIDRTALDAALDDVAARAQGLLDAVAKARTVPVTCVPDPTGPAAGKRLAFADNFGSLELGPGKRWGWKTSAYEFGDRNPSHYKRDWIRPSAMRAAGGQLVITATPAGPHPHGGSYWYTGLLTTEPGPTGGDGFRVQAGDFLVCRVQLPTGNLGAWPALWTWDGPAGEVDVFEWHSDNPDLLEFTNHTEQGGHAGHYYRDPEVGPGRWLWIGAMLGADDVTYYTGPTLDGMTAKWSDGRGIGAARPYLIANLSVGVSQWHASPHGTTPIVMRWDTVRVYR